MQRNEETTKETNTDVSMPFSLSGHINGTINASKVIDALQTLHDCEFSLHVYKDAISNIMFFLHQHEKGGQRVDTEYIRHDLEKLYSLSQFLQDITDRQVIEVMSIPKMIFETTKQIGEPRHV